MENQIKKAILQLASFLGVKLPSDKETLSMHLDMFVNMITARTDLVSFISARTEYVNKHMVSRPANEPFSKTVTKIIDIASPSTDDDSEAREIAARVWESTSRFGYPNPHEASEYIGEIGWEVVQNYGGWQSLCESLKERERTSFTAQVRDLIKSKMTRKRAGLENTVPALPESHLKQLENLNKVKELISETTGGSYE